MEAGLGDAPRFKGYKSLVLLVELTSHSIYFLLSKDNTSSPVSILVKDIEVISFITKAPARAVPVHPLHPLVQQPKHSPKQLLIHVQLQSERGVDFVASLTTKVVLQYSHCF